jgi:hypothetical protein
VGIKKSQLSVELEEFFDLKNAKARREKNLTRDSLEALNDIRLLTHMFRDGVPDLIVHIGDDELIKWDANIQKLLYINKDTSDLLEATSKQTMIKLRPYLSYLVKQARDFYKD